MDVLLDQEAPGLAKKLQSLPLEIRRNILARACLAASECLTDLEPSVQRLLRSLNTSHLLSPDDITKAKSLAEAADGAYLELQGRGKDNGKALKFFSEARLLNAMVTGFGGVLPKDTTDAVYEICKVCDDATRVIGVIESDVNAALKK